MAIMRYLANDSIKVFTQRSEILLSYCRTGFATFTITSDSRDGEG